MGKRLAALAAAVLLLAGCDQFIRVSDQRTVQVSAVGYGTASAQEGYSDSQRRLLAMRASKLDAYRNLAEQVYGLRINGHTAVSAMVVENDRYRGYVEATVRGGRVVSVTPLEEATYETLVELELGPTFFNCLSSARDPAVCTPPAPAQSACAGAECYDFPDVRYYHEGN